MSAAFLDAAASYFGLADTSIRKKECFTDSGELVMVFEIPLSIDDIEGITQRMKVMREESVAEPEIDLSAVPYPAPEEMRQAYNALSPAEKSRYGSFARFMAMGGDAEQAPPTEGAGARQVVHLDTPEEPEPTNMDAVWVNDEECSPAQRQFASDSDFILRRHLIQWAMLTDEQKQKAKL